MSYSSDSFYNEQYIECCQRVDELRNKLFQHSKNQYMDPDSCNYTNQMSQVNTLLQEAINLLSNNED
jgi:hypothetical protein